MADIYGLQNLGFLTLTFKENITDPKEAQRRFNSLATHILKPRYGEYIAIRERQKRGAIHYHLLVPVFNDIRTGFDWTDLDTAKTLPRGKRYPSASAALRAEWRFWRQNATKYGFGRTEILPVRSSREAISAYIGKYLGKDLRNSTSDDKGARRISITSGIRAGTIHFQLLNSSTKQWRQNVAKFAQLVGIAYQCKINEFSDLTKQLGPRWAYLNATMVNDLTDERMALYLKTPRDRLRAWILADPKQKQSEIETINNGQTIDKNGLKAIGSRRGCGTPCINHTPDTNIQKGVKIARTGTERAKRGPEARKERRRRQDYKRQIPERVSAWFSQPNRAGSDPVITPASWRSYDQTLQSKMPTM